MTQFFGFVASDGSTLEAGSENWSAEKRDTGLYKVTLSSGRQPVPVACVSSNNLSGYQTGKSYYINITDVGIDDNGRSYFGVATRSGNNLAGTAFSFQAETPD